MATSNGDPAPPQEQSKKEKKEASMKRYVKVVDPELEVRDAKRVCGETNLFFAQVADI